ncbi:hypothetical protein pEaSNUABM37_00071 [Erwinia phage pEa_SNUABM_37]|nr:hypothetical protein pEaSNUABM37_00071 [Erwinia phage pEa_SNUABM_37]QXO10541.1 hypothetical protein pEaSNUABM48_00071 [Erwinia phage pEa_SNUABM_48]
MDSMSWFNLVMCLLVVIVPVSIGMWLCGDHDNRKYLSRYINGANSAISRFGHSLEIPLTNISPPSNKEQMGFMYAIDGFTSDGDAILSYHNVDGDYIEHRCVEARNIESTIEMLKFGIDAHGRIIFNHGWARRLFERE